MLGLVYVYVICEQFLSLNITRIPRWISCHMHQTSYAVWSMAMKESEAVNAMVLAKSIQVMNYVLLKYSLMSKL